MSKFNLKKELAEAEKRTLNKSWYPSNQREETIKTRVMPKDGPFIAYKSVLITRTSKKITEYKDFESAVIKVLIPAHAQRVKGKAGYGKARASVMYPIEFVAQEHKNRKIAYSHWDGLVKYCHKSAGNISHRTKYTMGKELKPDSFNPDNSIVCGEGLHFYMTEQEAGRW